jgi:phospholipase/lecithinase/hemolysin
MIRQWAIALGIAGAMITTPAWADRDTERYTSITVFGDSLVDAGNYYLLTGQPDPAQGFYNNHFTNGPDYPDLISKSLFGVETTPSGLGGSNYGIAAARIIDTGDPIPDIQAQIDEWKASPQAIDPNGLYILNFGANDVFAIKGAFGPNALGSYTDPSVYLKDAADQYVAAIQSLIDGGVRNILMTDFPLALDPLTIEANGYLAEALKNLKLNSDTSFMFYSLSDFNIRILSDPGAYGLGPMTLNESCIDANAQANDCKGYFYFDGVHPVAAVQEAAFEDMNAKFGLTASVPEPATWAMMIVGFGAVCSAMRYRRRSVKVAYA